MGIDPISLLSLGASALGTVSGAFGSYEQGQSQMEAARWNSQMALANAQTAKQNAQWAGAAGEEQTNMSQLKTRATVGAIKANEAAGNVDVNSGSPVDVRSSAASLGELDALTIRSNAARHAYGYQTEAASFEDQAQLDKMMAENASTAGDIGAATTFLGGMGNTASNWLKFQNAGVFA